ncbi:hypothetical protein MKW92_010392 [Papaver armeniacum]|nr:hypothetical protein MKW92_010392 [Papaver armeniacum]
MCNDAYLWNYVCRLQAWVLRNSPREDLNLQLSGSKREYFRPDEYWGGYLGFYKPAFSHMSEQAATPTPYNPSIVSLMSRLSASPTSSNPAFFKEVPSIATSPLSACILHLINN